MNKIKIKKRVFYVFLILMLMILVLSLFVGGAVAQDDSGANPSIPDYCNSKSTYDLPENVFTGYRYRTCYNYYCTETEKTKKTEKEVCYVYPDSETSTSDSESDNSETDAVLENEGNMNILGVFSNLKSKISGNSIWDIIFPEDTDKDGINDKDEDLNNDGNFKNDDSDKDGIPDYMDKDDDNDGVPTKQENPYQDTDNDGKPDYLDSDDDNDGLLTKYEMPDPNQNFDASDARDTDKDGKPDYLDSDDDNDRARTTYENPDPNGDGNPSDAQDTDKDGRPDYLDDDDDRDGIKTKYEIKDIDPANAPDTDKDGKPDYLDDDDDNDNIKTWLEEDKDTDGDGKLNYLDDDDDDDEILTKDEDADGDGNPRNDYSDPVKYPFTPDYLNPNIAKKYEPPEKPIEPPVTKPKPPADDESKRDREAIPLDTDGDGDFDTFINPLDDKNENGIPDYKEPDADPDGDGLTNKEEGIDEKSSDPNAIGKGRDSDKDGDPDYMDTDDDGDGVPTIKEGKGDSDNDGKPDYLDKDSDNDGILDKDDPAPTKPNSVNPEGDYDGDGILNKNEDANNDGNFYNDDTDKDGTPNLGDKDDDGDGFDTEKEDLEGDTDKDGVPNYLDMDDDGDSILSIYDNQNNLVRWGRRPPHLDPDDDNDRVLTINEGADPNGDGNPSDAVDSDKDGVPNYLDRNDDDDDKQNWWENEKFGRQIEDTNKNGDPTDDDSDGDGIPNYLDAYDSDPNLPKGVIVPPLKKPNKYENPKAEEYDRILYQRVSGDQVYKIECFSGYEAINIPFENFGKSQYKIKLVEVEPPNDWEIINENSKIKKIPNEFFINPNSKQDVRLRLNGFCEKKRLVIKVKMRKTPLNEFEGNIFYYLYVDVIPVEKPISKPPVPPAETPGDDSPGGEEPAEPKPKPVQPPQEKPQPPAEKPRPKPPTEPPTQAQDPECVNNEKGKCNKGKGCCVNGKCINNKEEGDLLAATVLLKADGKECSGTIIDFRDIEALILTCGEFSESDDIKVDFFNSKGDKVLKDVPGKFNKSDKEKGLGLVSVCVKNVKILKVAPPGYKVEKGDGVASLNVVKDIVKPTYTFVGSIKNSLIETAGVDAVNRGGGLISNCGGFVIGVYNGGSAEGSFFVALDKIQKFLNELGLEGVYNEKEEGKRFPKKDSEPPTETPPVTTPPDIQPPETKPPVTQKNPCLPTPEKDGTICQTENNEKGCCSKGKCVKTKEEGELIAASVRIWISLNVIYKDKSGRVLKSFTTSDPISASGTIIDTREGQAFIVTVSHLNVLKEKMEEELKKSEDNQKYDIVVTQSLSVDLLDSQGNVIKSKISAKLLYSNKDNKPDIAFVTIYIPQGLDINNAEVSSDDFSIKPNDNVLSIAGTKTQGDTGKKTYSKVKMYNDGFLASENRDPSKKGNFNVEINKDYDHIIVFGDLKPGNSGGGLFSKCGELIGVLIGSGPNAINRKESISLYLGKRSIRTEIKKAGYGYILDIILIISLKIFNKSRKGVISL